MEFTDDECRGWGAAARADLLTFCKWMFVRRRNYLWGEAPHHEIICNALTRVFNGDCKRLIINIPPRYSKTEIAVVNFIAWALGHRPDAEFIHVSYAAPLALNNSANVRALVQHEAFAQMFPECQIDSDAKGHWTTTKGGVMYAVGAGGTLTGMGAGKQREGFGGAIIIDDPHKPDEARSDVIRQGVLDWFQNTLESRKNNPSETPIILIMQRLHEKDLAGWLLDGGNGEEWERICLDCVQTDETGHEYALWPEKHTLEDLRRMERAAPYTFAGQYRQRPAPPEGGVIKPGALVCVDALPIMPTQWVRAWDLAASVNGDFTVGAKFGRLNDGRFVIADVVRLRSMADERDAALVNTAARDGPGVRISLPQDPGQAGKTQALYLTRQLAGYAVSTSPESGDKLTRALPLAAQINVGNVLMLRAPWNDALINEMRMFPNGVHDDQVDALSRATSELIAPPKSAQTMRLPHMRR